jgi:RiboL-PSP-HEPN
MRWKLDQQEKKIDNLFELVGKVSDDETKAILSKFLCVRTSGFIESSIKNLLNEYVQGSSPKNIQQFVSKKIKTITNLKFDRLAETLGLFSDNWKECFIEQITDEQKAALNSVVSNRNNIAHGETDSISYEIMKDYYLHARSVVDLLKIIIKK